MQAAHLETTFMTKTIVLSIPVMVVSGICITTWSKLCLIKKSEKQGELQYWSLASQFSL